MFGVANGNRRAAPRLYQGRFTNRSIPNHKILEWLHRQLCENGSFIVSTDGRGRSNTERQPHVEEIILKLVDDTFHTSIRAIACRVHISQPSACRMLNKEGLNSFDIQSIQAL